MDNFLFRFKIGNFTCSAIKDGEDWDRNVLFIRTGRHQVLIDTGNGDATSPRGLLLERLEALGFLSATIDVVILSHGDIDHIAGTMDTEGKLMFPNARHVLAHDESTFWSSNVKRTSASHNVLLGEDWTQLAENFPRGRLAQLSNNLDLIDPETEIVPGIRAISAPGHTPGMIAIELSVGKERLLCLADVIYPADVKHTQGDALETIGNPEWHAAVDVNPDQALKTRDRLFEYAAREQALLMAYHLPFPGLGHVVPLGSGWQWKSFEASP